MSTPDTSELLKDSKLPLSDAAELSTMLSESCTPVISVPPKGCQEHRTADRYVARWQAHALITPEQLCQGRLLDISSCGAALLLDVNVKPDSTLKLHIHIPPLHVAQPPHVIEVQCKVIYTVHDHHEFRFRIGLSFLSFNTEHDPVFLKDYLDTHAIKLS